MLPLQARGVSHIVIRRKRVTDIAPESSWDSVLRDWAILHGWYAWHLPDSRRTPSGLPDWLLIRPPRCVWIEGKVPGGRLRPEQKRVLEMLSGCTGLEVIVAVWPDDWPKVRDTLL